MGRIRIDLIAMYGVEPHHPTRKCAHFHKVTLYNKLIELLKKGKQMNKSKEKCAPENIALSDTERWKSIDRHKAEEYVRKLQARIVKAQREGRNGKVKSLQWLLTHSFYARYLAVVRVTTNKGKRHRRG